MMHGWVVAEVDAIAALAWDSAEAHQREDKLHHDVLRAIAHGAENASALAHEALRTTSIEFNRWCAQPPAEE